MKLPFIKMNKFVASEEINEMQKNIGQFSSFYIYGDVACCLSLFMRVISIDNVVTKFNPQLSYELLRWLLFSDT